MDSVFKRRPRNDRNAMEVGGRAGQAKRKGNSCDDSKEIYQKVWLELLWVPEVFFFLISNWCKFEAILPGLFYF